MESDEVFILKKSPRTEMPQLEIEENKSKHGASAEVWKMTKDIDEAVQFDYGKYAKTHVKKRTIRYVQKRD